METVITVMLIILGIAVVWLSWYIGFAFRTSDKDKGKA